MVITLPIINHYTTGMANLKIQLGIFCVWSIFIKSL